MPANPKYLNTNKWQRFAKITAGILGGYILSFLLHACLLLWFDREVIEETATYSIFLVWTPLALFPFLFKHGWLCWILYLSIALLLLILIYAV